MSWQDITKARLPALLERTDEPDRLERLIERLEACVAEGGLSLSDADLALGELAGTPNPCQTLLYLLQLCDSDEGPQVLAEEGALETFLILAAQGEYPARIMLRRPEELSYLTGARLQQLARGVDSLKGELHGRIEADVRSGVDREDSIFVQLRRLKRRESLRIYLREIENLSSVRQTTAEIAALAEACLDVACAQGAQVLGHPELTEDFCVLGMGKLGGRELNFSSDVDLIYICSTQAARDAETNELIDGLGRWVTRAMDHVGAEGYVFRVDLRLRPEGSRGALVHSLEAMNDYYLNWGRTWERSAMLKARPVAGNRELGEQLLESLEPFMYRRYLDFEVIDELRSMKEQIDRNAHVSAVVGLEDEEEREPVEPSEPTSSLKARLRRKMKRSGASSGSRAGRSSRLRLSGSSPLDKSHPEEPTERETLGEQSSESRLDKTGSPFGWDVKIGVGGIREIEFFVQALQLIHCGMRPALRVRRTLDALDRLLYSGLITHEDHAALADAYDLFRRVEHRVQMEHDRQAHRLPADRAGFERLARRMFMQPDRLEEELTGHRKAVAGMFERLFTESAQTPEEPTVRESQPSELATVLGVSPDRLNDAAVIDALRNLGFRRPRQVAGQIQMLREKTYGPFGRHAGTRQSQLSRYVLQACASAPNPDQAFSYWSRLSTVVGDRPGVFDMLFENPHATRLLLHVFGSSNFLASIVMREPNVIDYLLGSGTVAIVRERDEMSRELGRRLSGIADPSHRLGRVRRFHQEEVLRIALHEVAGTVDIDQTVRQLSMLAEVVLEAVLAEVYEALVEGMGLDRKALPDFDELPFVVLGMGKLGGRELAFGSDLDVIFVYEARPEVGLDHPFFARLAQRLVRNLTSVSQHGKLYEVDTRLRPSGRQGTLVVSLDAFRDYHRERADLWERQAMIRARSLSGNRKLRAELMELREQFAFEAPLREDLAHKDLATSMRQMRDKIAESLGGDGRGVDIKTHPGGMVDIEFLTQYLQLAHAGELGGGRIGVGRTSAAEKFGEKVIDGPRSQNMMRALARLAQADDAGRVDLGVDCIQLLEDYRTLRRVEARLRMSEQRPTSRLPDDDEELDVLARRLGYQGAGARQQLESELDTLLERVQGTFESVMPAANH